MRVASLALSFVLLSAVLPLKGDAFTTSHPTPPRTWHPERLLRHSHQSHYHVLAMSMTPNDDRQNELERSVSSLKNVLEKSQRLLVEQRDATSQIKDRLLDAEDQLEMTQNEMKRKTSEMGRKIQEERDKLSDTVRRAEEDKNMLRERNERDLQTLAEVREQMIAAQEMFEEDQAKLREQLEAGTRERRRKAEGMARRYEKIRAEMTELWQGALREKRNTEKTLKVDIAKRDEAISALTDELVKVKEESDKVNEEKDMKDEVWKEQKRIEAGLTETISTLENEIVKLMNDIKELESKGNTYEKQVSKLNEDLSTETLARESLENQLKKERAKTQAEQKRMLENFERKEAELVTEASAMQRKIDTMQKELFDLMAKSKNAAKLNESKLAEKYEGEIRQKVEYIGDLESKLSATKNVNAVLRSEKAELFKQRDDALGQNQQLNEQLIERYTNIPSLVQTVAAQENKIENYEGHYREILKLALKLTGKRLKKFVRRRRSS